MNKSIVVAVEKKVKHLNMESLLKNIKFIAHDDKDDCNIGDTVRIMEALH